MNLTRDFPQGLTEDAAETWRLDLRRSARECGIPAGFEATLLVCADELIHDALARAPEAWVALAVELDAEAFVLELKDRGPERPAHDGNGTLGKVGAVEFLRRVADSVEAARDGGLNRLTVRFRRPRSLADVSAPRPTPNTP